MYVIHMYNVAIISFVMGSICVCVIIYAHVYNTNMVCQLTLKKKWANVYASQMGHQQKIRNSFGVQVQLWKTVNLLASFTGKWVATKQPRSQEVLTKRGWWPPQSCIHGVLYLTCLLYTQACSETVCRWCRISHSHEGWGGGSLRAGRSWKLRSMVLLWGHRADLVCISCW